MKRRIPYLLALGALMAFCGCVFPELQLRPAGATLLTQTELERLFYSERRVEFLSAGTRAAVMYFPDGRQQIDWNGGSDKGTYRIKNEEFCSTWTRLRNGVESCSKIYQIDENELEFRSSDGTVHAIMRLK